MASITGWPAGTDWQATYHMVDGEGRVDLTADNVSGAQALVPAEDDEVHPLTQARPARGLVTQALGAALPALGRALQVAGPALLTLAASQALRRLGARPQAPAVVRTELRSDETCQAVPALVIVQIVHSVSVACSQAVVHGPGCPRPAAPRWLDWDD